MSSSTSGGGGPPAAGARGGGGAPPPRPPVDLVLGLDAAPAAASDDLADTVDYGGLALAVKEAVERDPVDLIETLAERIAGVCLTDDRVDWCRITVHKPRAPIEATFRDVALTIHRSTRTTAKAEAAS